MNRLASPNTARNSYMVGSGLLSPQQPPQSGLQNRPHGLNHTSELFIRDNSGNDLLIRNGAKVERGTARRMSAFNGSNPLPQAGGLKLPNLYANTQNEGINIEDNSGDYSMSPPSKKDHLKLMTLFLNVYCFIFQTPIKSSSRKWLNLFKCRTRRERR